MKKKLFKIAPFYSKLSIGVLILLISTLNTSLFGQSTCTCAKRWTGGDSWPNSTVGGIIACGSSAETQSNIQNNCTYPVGGVSGMPTSCSTTPTWIPPTVGCKIAWFNYDVKAFASSYQFQIVGSNLNYALFYSTNPSQTLTNGLSGDCSSLKFLRCGLDASSTFSVADIVELPDFAKPTNLYLLVWADNCGDFKFNFKARFGCGETTPNLCELEIDQTQITTTCKTNGTFDLNIPITGANNTYKATITSGGITYTSNSLTLTNLAATPPVISGTLTFSGLPQTIASPYTVSIKGTPLTGCDKTFQLTAPVCCTPSVTCPTLSPPPLNCNVVAQSGTLTPAEFLALGGGAAIVDCGQAVTIAYNDVLSSTDACIIGRTMTRTYTIKIGTGFTKTCSVVYNINAVPDLILTGTANLGTLAGCNTALPTNAQNVFTATGNCAGTAIATTPSAWTVKSVSGCLVTYKRTWSATDACGKTSTAEQTVTITEDLILPVINPSGTTLTLGCNPSAAAIEAALGTATVTEACSTILPTAVTSGVTPNGCLRSQTRTWTATDACGNAAVSVSRIVTWTEDITLPVINATGSTLTLGCNPTAAQIEAALGTATVTEACSTILPTAVTSGVTSNGCLRSQTRTWTATDACNNAAVSVSRVVTWTEDLTLPVITATGSTLALGCNPSAAAIEAALGTATATDNCSVGTPTFSDGTVSSNGCTRSKTRTWNVSDACGNAAIAVSRTATWTEDLTLPVLVGVPGNITTCNLPTPPTVTATDNCSTPSVAYLQTGTSPNFVRTWTATDGCGNTSSSIQAITIVQPPIGGIAKSDKSILCKVSTEKFTLSVTGNTGVVLKWQMDEDCNGTWVDIANSNASQIMVIPPSPENANDYCLRYRALIVYADASIACDPVASTYVEVKVDIAAVGGRVTLQSNQTATSAALCPGENIVLIPVNYFGKIARWEYSYASSPIWYTLAGSEMAPSITVNESFVTETVYFRAVICSGLGYCTGLPSVAYSASFRIVKKLSCPIPDAPSVKNDVKSEVHFTIQKAYPNPSSDYITLEIEHFTEGVAQIEIMDLTGRIVQRTKHNLLDNVNKIELDVNTISSGLYIVRIKDSSKQEAIIKVSKL